MIKSILLLSTLLLLSACAERGYKLTVNNTTGTVTAQKSIDIRQSTKETSKTDITKMQKAVKKEQTRGKPMGRSAYRIKTNNETSPTVTNIKTDKVAIAQKTQDKKIQEAKEEEVRATKEHQIALEEEKRLLSIQEERTKEALRLQLVEEKRVAQLKKEATEKREQEKLYVLKQQKEAAAVKRKLAEEKRVQLAKEQEEEKRPLATNQHEAKEVKAREVKKSPLLSTQSLTFKPSSETYQKFGTSEIHGHVIYLSPNGVEVFLKNTKIYLVAQNTKMDHWYTNYYLKNSHNSADTQSIVNYINATKLNLERNFAFYGLAPGNYYVVIESSYPKSMAKNKKVYITKRITVEKYKKIMTVFSKKL